VNIVPDPPHDRPPAAGWAYAVWAGLVILAAMVRMTGLEHCPEGLFRDEAEKGYNAWAIATEGGVVEFSAGPDGRAIMGWKRWPYVVDVMGVKTSALYQYAGAPFVRFTGLTVAGTRMPAALAGTLTVALIGLLLLRLWPASYALAAMAWLALCPWHYLFSRWALQGIFVPLGMVGVLAGAAGVDGDRRWGFPLAGASLGFIFYAYSGAQPFALLWAAGLAALYGRQILNRPVWFALGVTLLAVAAVPRAWIVLAGGGAARLDAVAIWTEEGASAMSVAASFTRNYLAHFNPVFLFLRGDELPRHGIPGLGQLLWIDAVLLPLGAWISFRRRMPLRGALLMAFLLGPVGAAITRVGIPHALRSLPMVLPAAVWGGIGLAAVADWVRDRVVRGGMTHSGARPQHPILAPLWRGRILRVLVITAAMLLAGRVYGIYLQEYRRGELAQLAFAASERAAFEKVRAERREGENVWVSGAILYAPYFALFYNGLPPRVTATQGLEALGFTVYPPEPDTVGQVEAMMRPGDWRIDFDPITGHASVFQKPG
jgi:hypothetical protein